MIAKRGGRSSLASCSCPLVFAGELWRRVILNKEAPMKVARDLGMGKTQAVGVLRILKNFGRVPSRERLAVIAMRVPDVTNTDIAEWFDEPVEWARWVRRNASVIRKAEVIPDHLEYFDDGYRPGDPSPKEIWRRAREIRLATGRQSDPDRVEIRAFQWNGWSYAAIPSGS